MAVHSINDQEEEVIWYAKITAARHQGKKKCYLYLVQYFDVCSLFEGKPNVSGCYELVGETGLPIDEDNIIDKIMWIDQSPECACKNGQENCKYFLGDEQYDKLDVIFQTRIESR